MLIGIISDTHDNVEAVERAITTFEAEGVETVVHCGDFIAPLVVPYFSGFTLHGVLGNNDGEIQGLYDAFNRLDQRSTLHGRFASLELDGIDIAVLHGESKAEVEALADSGVFDLVCYGHYHVRDHRRAGDTVVLNPGAHFPPTPDEHRTVATVDTDDLTVDFHELD